jgi:uncharacterized membrane protein (UPF0127 family)
LTALQIENADRGTSLALYASVADTWWTRFRGLLGRPPLIRGEALLLRPCRAVHTRGMRYGIDVAFLDRRDRVLAMYHNLLPGRRTHWHWKAAAALELPAGALHAAGTREGDHIRWSSAPERHA